MDNIFTDIKNDNGNCPICQQLHKNIYKKLPVKQFLIDSPKEHYVAGLLEIEK